MGLNIPKWVLIGGVVVPVLFLGALALIPTETLSQEPTVCLFKNLFGIECLGCGMTRAISSALHGRFTTAMQYNHFVIIALPAIITLMTFCFQGVYKLRVVLKPPRRLSSFPPAKGEARRRRQDLSGNLT